MAKNINPIIRLQGSFKDMVFVKSRTYGDHVRAMRGSVKQATVNEKLQFHADKTAVVNEAAKRVHDLVKVYADNFKESILWQQLLSCMRKSTTDHFDSFLKQLNGLEINSKYPLKRFGKIPVATIEIKKKKLLLTLSCYTKPVFKNDADCYFYEVCILFFGTRKENDCYTLGQTEWIKKDEQPINWLFKFDMPARTKYYLVCLKMYGGIGLQEKSDMGSVGIAVVLSDKII